MNIYLKLMPFILATSVLSGCAYSSEKDFFDSDRKKAQCDHAMYGKLDTSLFDSGDPQFNSYVFACSLAIVVPLPNESRISVKNRIKRKLEIADFLMTKNMDVSYKDETDSTLLMTVIISFMPDEWKLDTAKVLIQKGCDVKAKNSYGKTAIILARNREDFEMVSFLSKYLD